MTRIPTCIECGELHDRHRLSIRCTPCRGLFQAVSLPAIAAVAQAIRRGQLVKAKVLVCTDCGKQARDWDHRDYRRPLDVQAVCRPCNLKRGPALWREAA